MHGSRRARIVVLTGPPGVGKTTVVVKASKLLQSRGYSVDGFYSREIRERGVRVGFEMIDVKTGERLVLAHVRIDGARFGKYKVNIKGVEEFVPRLVDRALAYSDVIICDEIGPMELLSPSFKRSVARILASDKRAIVVVHRSMKDPLMKAFVRHPDSMLIEVSYENRDELPTRVFEELGG